MEKLSVFEIKSISGGKVLCLCNKLSNEVWLPRYWEETITGCCIACCYYSSNSRTWAYIVSSEGGQRTGKCPKAPDSCPSY